MRKATALVVLAILVAASLSVGLVAVGSGRQTARPTSTTVSSSTFESPTASSASTVSSSGLELSIALNATRMEAGETLGAVVSLYNTLDRSLSLLLAPGDLGGGSISSWQNYDFICGNGGGASYLVGFAVLDGRFSAANLSLAPAPLQVAAQADLPCVYLVLSTGETITFSPGSDNASIPGTGLSQEPVALNVTTYACIVLPSCRGGTGLYGYWSTSEAICCPASSDAARLFRYFTPGDYTIVAQDVWGQEVFAHFQVVPAPGPAEAISAQESPFSGQRAPVIGLTLANLGNEPIATIGAGLTYIPARNSAATSAWYPFAFVVSPAAPLLPGQTAQDVRTLNGSLFDIGVSYPLTISGVFENGTTFSYTQQVQFVNEVPSP